MQAKPTSQINSTSKWEVDVKDNYHKKRFITFMYFFFLFFFSALVQILVIRIFIPFGIPLEIGEENSNIEALLFLIMLGSLISTMIFIIFSLSSSKELVHNFQTSFEKNKVLNLVVWGIIFFVGSVIISLVMSSIYGAAHDGASIPTDNANQDQLIDAIAVAPFVSFLTIVLIGPLMEEIAFRYGIIGSVKNKYFGLILSALVFGLMHMLASVGSGSLSNDLWTLPSYIWMGAVLGIIYIRTDDIKYSYTFHVFNNLLAFIIIIA